MSLIDDEVIRDRSRTMKCELPILNDPVGGLRMWVRAVIAQANIFGVKDTIDIEWEAVDMIDVEDDSSGQLPSKGRAPTAVKAELEEISISQDPISELKSRSGVKLEEIGEEREESPPHSSPADEVNPELKELKIQMEELKQMMIGMSSGFLTNIRKKEIAGTRGAREDWYTEAILKQEGEYIKWWRHPTTRKLESKSQYQARMILNSAIKKSLSKYPSFYVNELEGNNYKIVRNVIGFGQPSSGFVKNKTYKKLALHTKTKGMSYCEYERKLREYFQQMATAGEPISKESQRTQLIAGLEGDPRYRTVVREVTLLNCDYATCHSAFMQEAHILSDMWQPGSVRPRVNGSVNLVDEGKLSGDDRQDKLIDACPKYLFGICKEGNRCPKPHISKKKFEEAKKKLGKRRNKRRTKKTRDRSKNEERICYRWRDEGDCRFGENCQYSHGSIDGSVDMVESALQRGQRVKVVNVPRGSHFKGVRGVITGEKGERFLLKPDDQPGLKLDDRSRVYLTNTGLLSRNLAKELNREMSIMAADRMVGYRFRAACDPAADWTITPSEDILVKGSVRELDTPFVLSGFQRGGPVVVFRKVGLLCIRSNTGMDGTLAVQAYVSPMATRTLIAQAQLDEMGWYLEMGGGAARIRRKGSQANFLVLARLEETEDGLPVVDVTREMKFGEIDLRNRLGEQAGRKYPIPDEMFVTDPQVANTPNWSVNSACVQPIGNIRMQDDGIITHGEINLAQRYSQQERLELMHQMLGHTNYMRLAMMAHWDGLAPKPSSSVLAKACAVCAIAKAHALPVRQKSFEFKDDTILGHVYADVSVDMGKSIEGYKHFLSIFVQGAAKFFAFMLRTRAEANQWLIVWIKRAHTQHYPRKIKFLHVDNELNTNRIREGCLGSGTQILVNQRSAHEHNSKGERPIRTVTEIMRSILLQGGAHRHAYWPVAVANAMEVLGYLPPMRKLKAKPRGDKGGERPLTPNELWHGTKYPSYREQMRNLVTPFCEVTAIADDIAVRGGKTNNPGIPALYLGPVMSNDHLKRAHLIIRYDNGKRMTTRHVIPNSDRFPLIHGPTPGLKMHPEILNSNKGNQADGDLEMNVQESAFDPSQHSIVEWEGEEADRQTRHEAVNERLRLATGQDQPQEQEFQGENKSLADITPLADPNEKGQEEEREVTVSPDPICPEAPKEDATGSLGDYPTEGEHKEVDMVQEDAIEEQALGIESDLSELDTSPEEMPTLEYPGLQQDLKEAMDEATDSHNPFSAYQPDGLARLEEADQKHDQQQSKETESNSPSQAEVHPEIGSDSDRDEVGEQKRLTKNSKPKSKGKTVTWAKNVEHKQHKKLKSREKKKGGRPAPAIVKPTKQKRVTRSKYSKSFMSRTPQEKFPPGTKVMSRWGPAIVQRVLANGCEANLTWPDDDNPDAVYNTKLEHFWLEEDRPGESYDITGAKLKHGEINVLENEDKITFRGHDIKDLVGKVKARDINLSLPRHRHQIQHHVLKPLCDDAEAVELRGLLEKKAFGRPQALPPKHRKIPVMWVYLAKDSDDGSGDFKKMKARLTVRGDLEKQDVTKADAYSPVSHPVTYKILIVAHMKDKRVRFFVFDVEQAFLSTQHKRLVYVGHPPGYKIIQTRGGLRFKALQRGEMAPNTAMQLLLALYGGKECSRLFWEEFRQWHINYGFKTTHYEKCYLYLNEGDDFIKIAFHVDDGLVAQRGEKLWRKYLKDIAKRFTMKFEDLERRTKFLGNNFHLNRGGNFCLIEQSPSIDKMLQKFNMTDCSPKVLSPFPPSWPTDADLPKTPEEIKESLKFDMRSAVGSLNWIEGGSKPELARPLKCAARYAANHGVKHREMVKRMMRWCKKTRDYTMVLRGSDVGNLKMQIFTDASHATCPDTRRSVSGVVVKLAGNTILWKCLNLRIVSHSSTESELMALDKGATIGMYIKWLVEVIGGKNIAPTEIFVDNQSAITLANNPVHPDRNVHIHARFFYVRDLVEQGMYVIKYIKTGDQIADLLCVYKSGETFAWLYAIVTNVAICVKDVSEGKIVYKWQITPRHRYIQ